MESAVSSAVSMATTPLAPSKVPNLAGTMWKRKLGLGSSMTGRVVAVPQRRRDMVRMCVGEVRLAKEGSVKKLAEIYAEREPPKAP